MFDGLRTAGAYAACQRVNTGLLIYWNLANTRAITGSVARIVLVLRVFLIVHQRSGLWVPTNTMGGGLADSNWDNHGDAQCDSSA